MANNLTRSVLNGSRVVQIGFKRTLVDQQGKTAKDYVRQGIDQLGQAAEKVKQAVSNATATVSEAVSGDRTTNQNLNDAKRYGRNAADDFKSAANRTTTVNQDVDPTCRFPPSQPASTHENSFTDRYNPPFHPPDASDTASPMTDAMKEKAREYTEQAKSAVNKARDKIKSGADSFKSGTDRAAENIKYGTDRTADNIKSGTNKAAERIKQGTDQVVDAKKMNFLNKSQ